MYGNDDFSDFEDDVVDMTDPNRKKNNPYSGGYAPLSTYDTTDSYGAYSVRNDRLASGSKDSGRRGSNLIMDALYFIALIAIVGSIGYAVQARIIDKDKFINFEMMALGYAWAVFVINGLILCIRHKNPMVLIIAIFLPIFFPFVRSTLTGKFKVIAYIWFVGLIAVGYLFYSKNYEPMRYGYEEIDKYSGEYSRVVKTMKSQKTADGVKTEKIFKKFFSVYTISVVEDNNKSVIIKVEGDLKYSIAVTGSIKNTEDKHTMSITFEVPRMEGEYEIKEMIIDDNNVKASMNTIWSAMSKYTR